MTQRKGCKVNKQETKKPNEERRPSLIVPFFKRALYDRRRRMNRIIARETNQGEWYVKQLALYNEPETKEKRVISDETKERWDTRIVIVTENISKLNDWELEFLDNVSALRDTDKDLSSSQVLILYDLYRKVG